MCEIIIRETNRKGRKVCEKYKNKQIERFPDINKRPPQRIFKPFTAEELDTFFGIVIAAGIHKSNKEHINELWKSNALPIYRASMSRDRFKMMLRFIRFDNDATRNENSYKNR